MEAWYAGQELLPLWLTSGGESALGSKILLVVCHHIDLGWRCQPTAQWQLAADATAA